MNLDIVVLSNGLGNQMSQYAFYLQKASLNPKSMVVFDSRTAWQHYGCELGKVFGIRVVDSRISRLLLLLYRLTLVERFPLFSRPLLKVLSVIGIRTRREAGDYDFDHRMLKSRPGITFYVGGWHSEKYFSEVFPEVRETYRFQIKDDRADFVRIITQIRGSNSVSVHIRRGDFQNANNFAMWGAVCTAEYFNQAIRRMRERIQSPRFFLFTDDPDWVSANIQQEASILVRVNSGADSWKDLALMSLCQHHIISNSSFSWWGAWLNPRADKVVLTPRYFVNHVESPDVYPDTWERIRDV